MPRFLGFTYFIASIFLIISSFFVAICLFFVLAWFLRHHNSTLPPMGFPTPVSRGLPATVWRVAAPSSAALTVALWPWPAIWATPATERGRTPETQRTAVLCSPRPRPIRSLHLPAHARLWNVGVWSAGSGNAASERKLHLERWGQPPLDGGSDIKNKTRWVEMCGSRAWITS